MKNIFKILILILVGVSVTSCELLNWDDANRYREERGIEKKEVQRRKRYREERGRECYRTSSGYFYCEDTK